MSKLQLTPLFMLLFLMAALTAVGNQTESAKTKVVLLGTGTPNPDPEHSGCSVAVVVNETSYIIDFGPDLVRQAAALSPRYGGNIEALDVKNLKKAFLVKHGTWPNAYGFRFTTPDKVIVISGDTSPCENILKYGKGADILIHEVYSKSGFDKKDEFWKKYHSQNHTSTYELAEIANRVRPGLLVLYHILFWGATEEQLQEEISEKFRGKVIVGSDLDVFE